ncbi:MAG: glycosyltransferase family 39 protein [Euryarchaeota archaeon]|nr:glycosyltransferase family 39 protein [Euryarchaeota archaeon]
MLLAGALRVGFNYGPATDLDSTQYTARFAGNDDYYHWRVVQKVQETGGHVVRDWLLGYPVPVQNPRPPLYDWHAAIFGQILGFASGEAGLGEAAPDAGAYALLWGSALWGALTVIPIFMIGRAVFNNRTGLWAGFLLAASPAHIQRSGFGLGDHDAFIVFFLALGAYFFVRALQMTRDDVKVASWKDFGSVGAGFSEYVRSHPTGLAYAFLAGVSWAAIALSWEGFPYVLAIYAVYYVFQLVSNQIRQRDSTGDVMVFSLIVGTLLLLAIPFYWITGNVSTTLNSSVYVIVILAILSLALVPTRDLPAILVLPGILGIALVGVAAMYFLAPDILNQLVSANGYFNQSKLYSTIAEAQRTELGVFVFSIGFMTFFFALIGFVLATMRYFRVRERAMLFLVGWGLLSIYMGFAATRFVFNAAPIFAVLGGWVTVRILDWMNLKERLKNFQSLRQDSLFKATRSTLGAKQIFGGLFLLLTLVVPNLWFSVDAGIPSEARLNFRQNHPGARDLIDNRTGAFGQGFLDPDWMIVYGWLAGKDLVDDQGNPIAEEDRPAHMAWWDYGFWEVALAKHPTVADNFQNGHQLAGRYIGSQSEKEGFDWMSVRILEGDWYGRLPRGLSQPIRDYLARTDPAWPDQIDPIANANHYDEVYAILQTKLTTLEASEEFYYGLSQVSGKLIGYFLVDNRMLPYDDPQTPDIDAGSILYAPIFLANKNPDDFVQTVYVSGQTEYSVKAYTTNAEGTVVQLDPIQVVDNTGRCYFVSGGLLFRATTDCKRIDYEFNNGEGLPVSAIQLRLKDAYYRTMFYKGFVGGDKPPFGDYPREAFPANPSEGNGTAGKGLRHWRLVNGTNAVKLLQYYRGASVSGTVSLEGGGSLAGFTVEAADPFGIPHDSVTIGSDGRYTIVAPFNYPEEGGIVLRVRQGDSIIAEQRVQVSLAQAMRRVDPNVTVDFSITPATLDGFVYYDRNGDGEYTATVDQPLEGASVDVDGRNVTSGADGTFHATGVFPGSKNVQATKTGYSAGSASVQLPPGGAGSVNISMKAAPITVSGALKGQDGNALVSFEVAFLAKNPASDYTVNATAFTDADGNFTSNLAPGGDYTVTVNGTTVENNKTVRYKGQTTISVAFGSGPMTIPQEQFALVRTEE